jgi:hypothetical protein
VDHGKHNLLPLSRAARKLAREIEIIKSYPHGVTSSSRRRKSDSEGAGQKNEDGEN